MGNRSNWFLVEIISHDIGSKEYNGPWDGDKNGSGKEKKNSLDVSTGYSCPV